MFFKRLGRGEIDRIVGVQLKRLEKILADRRITISLTDEAMQWLSDRGYDPVYGARPLKRVIQRSVQDPLANQILAGKVKDGDRVRITATAAGLVVNGEVVTAAG